MPFTLAHPLLVLPLRRFTPRWLDFPALVAGSMAPDVFYFIGQRQDAMPAHWPIEGLPSSLPAAASMLLAFHLTRRPMANLLPRPWRGLCLEACNRPLRTDPQGLAAMLGGLLIGVWSHFLWDSFTHSWGWFVQNIGFLNRTLGYWGPFRMDGARVAQYASSIVGLAVLGWMLWRWAPPQSPIVWDGGRGRIWLTVAALALAVGLLAVWTSTTLTAKLFYFSTASVSCGAILSLAVAFFVPPKGP